MTALLTEEIARLRRRLARERYDRRYGWRPWLQPWPRRFGLRSLLIAMLLMSLLLAYPAALLRESSKEWATVRKLQEAGAQMNFDSDAPRWLESLVGRERMQVATTVRMKSLDNCDELVRDACQLAHLREMTVEYCDMDTAALDDIRKLPELRHLSLLGCPVDDDVLALADRCPALEELNLRQTSVTPCALLAHPRLLQRLQRHDVNAFSTLDLQMAARRQKVVTEIPTILRPHLSLHTSPLRKDFIPNVGTASIVEKLQRSESGRLSLDLVNSHDLALIHRLPAIDSLCVSDDTVDKDLAYLRSQPNIQTLILDHSDVTDVGLEFVPECFQLKTLTMRGCDIGDSGLEKLDGLPLQVLDLQHTKVTDQGVRLLAKLPWLEQLNLSHTNVTVRGIDGLCGLKHLQTLDLSGCPLYDRGARSLLSLTRLQKLRLTETQITDRTVDALASLRSLTVLDLSHNPRITDEALIRLRGALPRCQIKRQPR